MRRRYSSTIWCNFTWLWCSSFTSHKEKLQLNIFKLWVSTFEIKFMKQLLLQYIFKRQDYNKPFFSTFAKTSMFVLYLLGFLLWRPWRQQCTGTLKRRRSAFVSEHFQRTFKGCFSCFYFSNGDRCLSSSFLVKTLIGVNVAVLAALHRNTSQWSKHSAQGELTLWTCLFRGWVPPVCL